MTLLNINYNSTEQIKPGVLLNLNQNKSLLSKQKKTDIVDTIKQSVYSHIKKIGKHIVNILIETNIITIKTNKNQQNLTFKKQSIISNDSNNSQEI